VSINNNARFYKNEINKKEAEFILQYGSNNPKVGYNQWPKFKKDEIKKQ